MSEIKMPAHYSINKIATLADLLACFPTGEADDLNFVMFGTSGIHGFYGSIAEVESGADDAITVLVIQPRIVAMRYGHIKVGKEDAPALRKLAESTAKVLRQYADDQTA